MNPGRSLLLAPVGLALAGAVVIGIATVNGPGLLIDSVTYLRGTRALLAGESLVSIGTAFPPGFAALWAASAAVVGDELLAARLLAAVSYAAMLAGFGCTLMRLPRPRDAWIWLLCLYLFFVPTMVSLYWSALSEGPFLALFSWALYAVVRIGHSRDAGWGCWALLYFCLAGMCLLRYAGVPLSAALLLGLFAIGFWRNWRMFGALVAFGVLTLLPLSVWLLVSSQVLEGGAPRRFAVHALDLQRIHEIGRTLSEWMGGLPGALAASLVIGVIAVLLANPQSRGKPQFVLSLTLLFCYLGFLLLSITFFDPYIVLDHRILAPLLPVLLLLVSSLPSSRWELPALGVLSVLLLMNLFPYQKALATSIVHGEGFSHDSVRNARIWHVTASLPEDRPIYTNAAEPYYLYFNRETYPLPRLYMPLRGELNPQVGNEWESMLEDVDERGGLVVWSEFAAFRSYYPTVDHLLEVGGLKILEEMDSGTILVSDKPSVGNAGSDRHSALEANNPGPEH